jgi:hypothetical protein
MAVWFTFTNVTKSSHIFIVLLESFNRAYFVIYFLLSDPNQVNPKSCLKTIKVTPHRVEFVIVTSRGKRGIMMHACCVILLHFPLITPI